MEWETWLLAGSSGFIGALLGGVLSAYGAIKAAKTLLEDAEQQEIRKQRVACVVQLMGQRYVIGDSSVTTEMKIGAHVALNMIPALFAKDARIMNKYRSFIQNRSNATLVELIKELDGVVKLGLQELNANDIETVLKL